MKNLVNLSKLLFALSAGALLFSCAKQENNTDENNADNGESANSVIESAQSKSDKNTIKLQGDETDTHANHYLTRDIQKEIFYFVLPDRFHNAKPENDNGDPNRPISFGGFDPTSKWAFNGGDIAGLEAKLDYLQGLGITSIWMTPILRNRAIQPDGFGHHGYWVVDFTEIDPHFGSNDDLKSLIAAAHDRNMKVFFDIITNHTADVIKYEECHLPSGEFINKQKKGCPYISSEEIAQGRSYTPFLMEGEEDVKVPAWLNDPKYYNNQGDSFWQGESAVKGDFVGLDDLDTSQPEVIDGLTEVFKELISEFKPDGFRIDTVKHVDIEFWQSFGPAIMEHAQNIGLPEFFIFGEVYDGNPAGLSKFTRLGKLPSVLDFSFSFNVRDVLFKGMEINRIGQLFDNDDYYRDHDSTPNDLLNFLGNHDMGRVGHFIESDAPELSEKEKLQRSKVAHSLMYFSRGVPVVYYGDEQGFTGDGGDVDSRENMDPSKVSVYNDNNLIGTNATTAQSNFDQTHPLYEHISKLAKLRKAHLNLQSGIHVNRFIDEQKRVYGFSRLLTEHMQDFLVVMNFSSQAQTLSLDANGLAYELLASSESDELKLNTLKLNNDTDQIEATLPAYGFALLRSKGSFPTSEISAIGLLEPYEENDRIVLPVNIEFTNKEQFNMAEVKFFALGENGSKRVLGYDQTFPYRAVLMHEELQGVQKILVEVSNSKEQLISEEFVL